MVRRELLFVVVKRVGGVVIKITEVLDALSATQVFVGFGFEANVVENTFTLPWHQTSLARGLRGCLARHRPGRW